MRKKDEVADQTSCLNKANDNELLFVLLGRDLAAPATIRFWCSQRVTLGKNTANDAQIEDAMALADAIQQEQAPS
jgi:hypothetical protein